MMTAELDSISPIASNVLNSKYFLTSIAIPSREDGLID